jgi:hypothetical protein
VTKGKPTPVIDGHKYCQRCKLTKPISDFYPDNNRYGVRSPCKQCIKADSQARYAQEDSSGKTRKALRLEARLELKRKLVAAAGGRCVRCGYEKSIHALDFHHIRKNKENNLATLLTSAAGNRSDLLAQALAEVSKCILLCANCHREVHAESL